MISIWAADDVLSLEHSTASSIRGARSAARAGCGEEKRVSEGRTSSLLLDETNCIGHGNSTDVQPKQEEFGGLS